MSTDTQQLAELVHRFSPRSLLAIGPAGEAFFGEYIAQCNECTLAQYPPAEALANLADNARYDLGLISHSLEHLPKAKAGQLVARLRDIHCRRLIAVVPIGEDWQQHQSYWRVGDLLAYGFVLIGHYRTQGRPVHIYAFDIDTYKIVPDWLNSKYWANPELFDKYWW